MKLFYKILISFLLLFNGMGAIYGGLHLMFHPDGSSIQLSSDWIKHTPFHDYFIPGMILFIANGLSSIFVFRSLLFDYKNYPWLVIAQGAILTGWIIIQIILIQTLYFLHYIMGFTGIALIILGILQLKTASVKKINS